MKIPSQLPFLLLLGARHVLAHAALWHFFEADGADDDYITSVCSPASAPGQSDPAPCIAIQNIETACLPNGTAPLALDAHAQCLCGGSYFAEWLGCRRCLVAHGALSQRNYTYFSEVLSSASEELCTGTPTAAFADLFTQVQAGVPEPTTGGTALSDVRSGDAHVSLYYTASGPQGPGVITGSATAATVVSTGSSSTTEATTGGSSGSASVGSLSSAPPATSSSSSNIAVPTGPSGGGKGVLLVAVGGVLAAAL
ncbi:hypothetical protein F4677DRAFT_192581 [Hypoxylon crocopeplum]|nr:hypothetical protein F4677DRAFT_192581 [Hypoxylon crocopeplum]